VLAAAAAAIVIALTGVFFPRGNPAAPTSAYAAEVRAVAEANQRLLLDAPGWKVGAVQSFTEESGEMYFTNGTTQLDVHWRPADEYDTFYKDRSHATTPVPIELLGQHGTMFRFRDQFPEYTLMLPPKGKNFLEVRLDGGSEAAYRELVGKLKPVGVEEWLDAMPASAVKPADNKRVVDEMLEGLPLPDGFDTAPLYTQTLDHRYHVGARVTGAVTCAWLDQWTAAKQSGDTAKATEAVAAMKTSRTWKVLLEMAKMGRYPDSIWDYADSIANGKTPVEYRVGLGCK
jgi:hypothetical protein